MISTILRSIRTYAWTLAIAALVLRAVPASAQFKPRPINNPATGEQFHIEATAALWFPGADINVASESLGIPGTVIDAKTDLGLTDQHLPQLGVVLRPARSHKFRMQYIPIEYDQTGTLTRDVIFNGQRYRVGLPVTSTLDWKAFRFNYEYDFIVKNEGFVGFITEVKYTDVQIQLNAVSGSTQISEFAHVRAPIPALGAIGRYYVVPEFSITGEFTAFKIPDSINNQYNAHYVDIDIYGTLNFTNNVGVQAGYRSLDLGYLIKADSGNFTLKGLYFGAVLRY
jgi:hypothetical protein